MNASHVNEIAALAADLISDQLAELLQESGEMPSDWPRFDTTLTRRDGDHLVVELVALNEGARTRDDGRRVLRISVEAVA